MYALFHFFDRLEDKIRARLSRYPISYGIIGGIGIVLFWRGVWHTTDTISQMVFAGIMPTFVELADGPLSFLIGSAILLSVGLFVSSFIGTSILVSGLKGEKKISEKTEAEIREEETEIGRIEKELKKIENVVEEIERHAHPRT